MDKYKIVAISTKGRYREKNEDCLFCVNKVFDDEVSVQYLVESDRDLYFAVFDGMGGMDSGKYASRYSCDRLQELVNQNAFEGDMGKVIVEINQCLCRKNDCIKKKMGSTVALLKIRDSKFRVANLGDSRCYYLGQQGMEQMSLDHTEAENYRKLMDGSDVDGKFMKQMECVLTQHLGVPEEEFMIEPFVSEARMIQRGEILVLCSDGASDGEFFSDAASILTSEGELRNKGERIVENVMEHGGRDNITLMLIEKE